MKDKRNAKTECEVDAKELPISLRIAMIGTEFVREEGYIEVESEDDADIEAYVIRENKALYELLETYSRDDQ